MTIHSFIATAIICGITTLTGCSTKDVVKIDTGTPATALTALAAPQAATSTEKAAGSSTTPSNIAENIPATGETTDQLNDTRDEANLDPVYFDFDSYLLNAEARDTLTHNAHWLAENQLTRVIIEGHADERGSDEYNLALAEKRAVAARRYIETLGVKLERMEIISYGENKPAMVGHDEATWAKNRRVEFVIVK